jgi:hypothetical protein
MNTDWEKELHWYAKKDLVFMSWLVKNKDQYQYQEAWQILMGKRCQ